MIRSPTSKDTSSAWLCRRTESYTWHFNNPSSHLASSQANPPSTGLQNAWFLGKSVNCRSDQHMFRHLSFCLHFKSPLCSSGIICYVSNDTDASHLPRAEGWKARKQHMHKTKSPIGAMLYFCDTDVKMIAPLGPPGRYFYWCGIDQLRGHCCTSWREELQVI